MARNYKRENEWRKEKYVILTGKVDKETGIRFKEKLKSNGNTFAGWLKENIEKYLKDKKK